ncbi:MAG: CAP domain-containing protein [bacterium]
MENAHNSLMNSKGHRRNILNENYTHIGIGIISSRQQGNMITQIFIGKPN